VFHADTKVSSRFTHGEMNDSGELGLHEANGTPPEARALTASVRQASFRSFDQSGALKFAQRTQNVQLEAARSRREVQALLDADKRDAALVEFLHGRHDVRQRPTESIETPNTNGPAPFALVPA
jgi:hypothetical protein